MIFLNIYSSDLISISILVNSLKRQKICLVRGLNVVILNTFFVYFTQNMVSYYVSERSRPSWLDRRVEILMFPLVSTKKIIIYRVCLFFRYHCPFSFPESFYRFVC